MNDFLHHGWTFLVGTLIGTVFFGGLWWTVRNAPRFANTGLWFAGSSLLRTLVAVGGFWLVSDGNWRNIVVGMAGFLAARITIIWLTRPVPVRNAAPSASVEVHDAPQP